MSAVCITNHYIPHLDQSSDKAVSKRIPVLPWLLNHQIQEEVMSQKRTRAWRRAQAIKNDAYIRKSRKTVIVIKFSRKYLWRRRDKMFLRRQEGYLSLSDD